MEGARSPFKPKHIGGYRESHAIACDRTLVTLLRFLGLWKQSIYVIGGLVPRYLLPAREIDNAGPVPTMDIDLVFDIEILSNIEAYSDIEANLVRTGFSRATNESGRPQHFRWTKTIEEGNTVIVDLLCDVKATPGRPVAVEQRLSALAIPGAHLAIMDFVGVEITAELLDGRGSATEIARVANITPFVVLKALAYDDRAEQKDAFDLIYCLENYPGGPNGVAGQYRQRMKEWPEESQLPRALEILRDRFVGDDTARSYRLDGPTSYAQFLTTLGQHEFDLRRQRDAAAIVQRFLTAIKSDQDESLQIK